MFKIGEFSKLSQVTVRALHYYERINLLVPTTIDPFTNYRYYSAIQLETVNRIKTLQMIGLPLKAIKKILESNDTEQLEKYYDLRIIEIESELEELQLKQQYIKKYQNKMKEGIYMEKYSVELKTIPERKVMSLRKTLPTFNEEGKLWAELYNESLQQKVTLTNPPMGLTFYHDKEYKENNVDIEIQSNIVGDYKDTSTVKFLNAPSFMMASVTFNGSYEQMPEVTEALATWIEVNNYQITGPMVNISHVSPAQDPNPENWVTESGFIVTK
ncbi:MULTISPECIES: MerR family transcriptional regulator [unclassified Enterococcus]|uniref:MerR family transcriptional regulator n=1 Tax=unclassified Enterococcus TaxID=2608891 RepID=UPI0015576E6E|nr:MULTISPECIES: MerR family transcriptional regulator [unclassified Enterococcus]MBS7577978.1 MerR family transcriptional regulator [Enterococcus sp. MMGLQ5-2]MBS7585161.1 MerR family transcriptional regulator [Enterococcus sp. MMGLQ5-1]NPD13018.1 MerR family transcriptional regulator [Enterococcus sp. MMGLQ5-1]NPD37808.1 MerR family transcriptional regulator [Enterococcus sp. MMGLQ5-2]